VLFLHGFPELSRSWLRQLPVVASAGFRAVAPDLRGYGRSDRRGPYDLETLAGDAAGLVRALGRERATVVGHDWGGAIAWATAFHHPSVVERLVILNAPHPALFAGSLGTNLRQLARFSYVLFFQVPRLPEWLLSRRRAAPIAWSLRRWSYGPSTWLPEQLEAYRDAFADVSATGAALDYYRALRIRPFARLRAAEAHRIDVPTLIVWGVHDPAFESELVSPEKLARWFAPGREPVVRLIEEAGHFVQNDAPERVNQELLAWLAPKRV
jgi:epoxide hydrolase 4